MKHKFLDILIVMLLMTVFASCTNGIVRTGNGFKVISETGTLEVTCLSQDIVRVSKYEASERPDKYSPSITMTPQNIRVKVRSSEGVVTMATSNLIVTYDSNVGSVVFHDAEGGVLLKEKPNAYSDRSQTFLLEDNEAVYGLGQHQHGVFNQRGMDVFLQQVNMEIGIPVIHSVKGYAVFWDNNSSTWYRDNEEGMTFDSETGDFCDYYFVRGDDADGVIAGLRTLTGESPMLPLWSFGFIQSKERYASQDELVSVVKKYRDLNIPLDAIVQDWRYWGDDHHWWNAVEFLSPQFPDPKGLMEQLNGLNANALISIWPSFGPNTNIYKELAEKGALMAHETFPQDHGVKVYDPWNPEARDIYWKYIKKNMLDIGIAGWWLDATEPEHNPIKPEDYDYMTPEGSFREVRNTFPIVTTGGVYDNQRAETDEKRVLILTRSAYLGQQRYGTHVWSGDVFSDWKVLDDQIPAALNLSLCGIPYWNSDIGGFWAWREFPQGFKDSAFHKLYTRWMQFAVFTGMMRSHGSNTPREIFRFGERGYWAFDAQEKFINLRYRLLPYIYGTSWKIASENATLMRALFMDWPEDRNVWNIDDEYMFGDAMLVAPVVTPDDVRSVYLPDGLWFDFWSGEALAGGQSIVRETPIDECPVYVKAGTVLPLGPSVQYAQEKEWDDLIIRIYPGADGEFVLYEDAGDGYKYEKGEYTAIRMKWDDGSRKLTICGREGSYPEMLTNRIFRVVVVGDGMGLGLDNENYTVRVEYDGRQIDVKL